MVVMDVGEDDKVDGCRVDAAAGELGGRSGG